MAKWPLCSVGDIRRDTVPFPSLSIRESCEFLFSLQELCPDATWKSLSLPAKLWKTTCYPCCLSWQSQLGGALGGGLLSWPLANHAWKSPEFKKNQQWINPKLLIGRTINWTLGYYCQSPSFGVSCSTEIIPNTPFKMFRWRMWGTPTQSITSQISTLIPLWCHKIIALGDKIENKNCVSGS